MLEAETVVQATGTETELTGIADPNSQSASSRVGANQNVLALPCFTEAKAALNCFAYQHGYAPVHRHTAYNKTDERVRHRVAYGCNRHGSRRTLKKPASAKRRPSARTRRC